MVSSVGQMKQVRERLVQIEKRLERLEKDLETEEQEKQVNNPLNFFHHIWGLCLLLS